MIDRVPGALAAALVDADGESVDYAGELPPFDVRIAAAHMRIVLGDVAAQPTIGSLRALVVRGARRSFIACPLPDDYALVVVLRRRAGFTASSRALYAAERALCREAGWTLPSAVAGDHAPEWCPVAVECDRPHRPSTVRASRSENMHRVEILGAIVGLHAREKGFRVRLDTGAEVTLVREAGGFWYSDASVDTLDSERSAPRSTQSASADEKKL
jgi:hypothetical protein